MKLAIKPNNTATNERCHICSCDVEVRIPIDLFMDDSFNPVCEQCGNKYTPELVRFLNHYYDYQLPGWKGYHSTSF